MTKQEELKAVSQRLYEAYEQISLTRSHKRRQDLKRAIEKLSRRKKALERELKG